MRKLAKDSDGNLVEIISTKGDIPSDFTEVPQEEVDSEELALARANKMAEIRTERDGMLEQNDVMWLIAAKKGESTADIEADAQELRDMTIAAQTYVDGVTDIENIDDIKDYDAFASLTLTQTYE